MSLFSVSGSESSVSVSGSGSVLGDLRASVALKRFSVGSESSKAVL